MALEGLNPGMEILTSVNGKTISMMEKERYNGKTVRSSKANS